MSLLLLFSLPAAFAEDEGFHCTAVWEGPRPGCPIEGWLYGDASRGTLEAAERTARRRLAIALEATADELAEWRDVAGVDFLLCRDAAYEGVAVECEPEPWTGEGDLCLVTFEDPSCWDGTVLSVDREGPRYLLEGRERMCDAVDEAVLRRGWLNTDEARRRCAESCLINTRVRCPS